MIERKSSSLKYFQIESIKDKIQNQVTFFAVFYQFNIGHIFLIFINSKKEGADWTLLSDFLLTNTLFLFQIWLVEYGLD